MKQTLSSYFAYFLLFTMGVLMVGSVWNDAPIMDELPHIPAGYSYLVKRDFRLNPEHPPLIKMIAALPLLFLDLDFPEDSPHWKDDINGQWDFGRDFLYRSGNDADSIVFWARMPIIILALATGWVVFWYLRLRASIGVALITLAMYTLSPTILAHSRFVTTDLGAAIGFLVGVIGFVEFLRVPSRQNIVMAGLCFGSALLLKFSLILLLPIYFIMFITWIFAQKIYDAGFLLRLLIKCAGIAGIAVLLVWAVYQYSVWNYPPERQRNDTTLILASYSKGPAPLSEACTSLSRILRCPAELTIWAADKPLIRPLAEYMLGLLMVFQRSAGGNTAYFLGEVSARGSRLYFPVAYATKEALPILLMLIWGALLALRNIVHAPVFSRDALREWIRTHFLEFSALTMIAVYWLFSIKSPLNIGVRHVMPTFPFIYFLAAVELRRWLGTIKRPKHEESIVRELYETIKFFFIAYAKGAFLTVLFVVLLVKMLITFPAYLSYYNVFGGGTDTGYLLITDSNYDWGQDLKRLQYFVEKNNIQKISLDYFGGGEPSYYLGDRFESWWSARGPVHGWFAVSATFRQEAFARTAPGFMRKPENEYRWLRGYEPVARAGKSIFIYNLP